MSLADELLADLECDGDVDEQLLKEDEMETDIVVPETNQLNVVRVQEICKLHSSQHLKFVLTEIEKYISKSPRTSKEMIGSVELDPE
jgi:hypothetical protein